INDDGTIPAVERSSLGHNTYRLNGLADAEQARVAPDLTASYVRSAVNGGTQTLTARIGNGGSAFVLAGANVSFYDGDPAAGGELLATVQTTSRLDPGTFEEVSITVLAASVT